MGHPEGEERKRQKVYLKKSWQKLSKFDEIHECTLPRNSRNFKQDKFKEIHS